MTTDMSAAVTAMPTVTDLRSDTLRHQCGDLGQQCAMVKALVRP